VNFEQSITETFQRIAAANAARLAVEMGGRSLTYAQLNRSANRIAHSILQKRGRISEPVVLLFDHDIDVIPAIFGTLKAGKFYVAVDSTAPTERLRAIIDDSKSSLLVANTATADIARDLCKRAEIDLLLLDLNLLEGPHTDIPLNLFPDDIAAITYTSGSTGVPKGVIETHGYRMHDTYIHTVSESIVATDRLSLIHQVCFASAAIQLYRALLNGASLHLFDVKKLGLAELPVWLSKEKITVVHLPPALFRQVSWPDWKHIETLPLRIVHLSGAPLTRHDFEIYQNHFPVNAALGFHMGTTETGGFCAAVVDHKFCFPDHGAPVGYPMSGKRVSLIDDEGHEIQSGSLGEIAVHSNHLTQGYWQKPELTDLRFFPDPGEDQRRLYKTGDLGTIQPDGFVIHMGRKDVMVKIRGYRVEMGEVETRLIEHPAIKDAGVTAQEPNPGDVYLAAYVVPNGHITPTVDQLRGFLRSKLPDYMIPSVFVFLDSLPLINGKLDRKSLPQPERTRPTLSVPYAAAQDEIDIKLVSIWERTFGVEGIGIDDNFFDLGGHSLLAARLFASLDKEFGWSLPLSVLIAAPTVRTLGNYFRSTTRPKSISPLILFSQAGVLPAIFAVPGVYGNVVGLADLCRSMGVDHPFYGLQSIGLDGCERPLTQIEDMARRFISEIRTVQSRGPYLLLGACFGAKVTCEIAHQLLETGEEIAMLALLDPIGLVNSMENQEAQIDAQTFQTNNRFSSFLNARVKLYWEEIAGLNQYERVRFLGKKLMSLGGMLNDRNHFRSIQREIHQLAVFNASKAAGMRYRLKRLRGPVKTLDIFMSNHPRSAYLEIFDWQKLWDGSVTLHHVPGRDSGDMLCGDNASVLGALLIERIKRVC
jgi:amino acid adenylation domain-containing protein